VFFNDAVPLRFYRELNRKFSSETQPCSEPEYYGFHQAMTDYLFTADLAPEEASRHDYHSIVLKATRDLYLLQEEKRASDIAANVRAAMSSWEVPQLIQVR
jgi:hypothetical protein